MKFAIIEGNWGTPTAKEYQIRRNASDYLCAVCEILDGDKKSLISPLFSKYEDAVAFIDEKEKGLGSLT
jgi:hypothetical protein